MERARLNKLEIVDILKRPFIDLRSLGIIMNKGQFRGSGLDKITGKSRDGSIIPEWHAEKKYGEIIDYARNEAEEFVKFVSWAYKELPPLLARFRKENEME